MNGSDAVVEQIVRRVMEQLSAGGAVTDGKESGESTEIVLEETVITGELLEKRLNGQGRVRIGAKSILTPSARDVLNNRKVEWHRGTTVEVTGTAKSRWLALVVQSTPAAEAAWEDVSRLGSGGRQRELVGNATEAVERGVSALCRGEADGVVAFTHSGAAVTCRANRNSNVRAAVVRNLQEAQAVERRMGANFVCIDPDGKSYVELRNLLRELTSGGAPQIPADWDE